MKNRRKHMVAMLCAFALFLQQCGLAEMMVDGTSQTSLAAAEDAGMSIEKGRDPAEADPEILVDNASGEPPDGGTMGMSDTQAGNSLVSGQAPSEPEDPSADVQIESITESTGTDSDDPPEKVSDTDFDDPSWTSSENSSGMNPGDPPEDEAVIDVLRLDNSDQTAADTRFPAVTLELKRAGGFPADASWKLEIPEDGELTRLTAGTELEQAEGLFLRFSVEVNGHACDLSGTEALFCCPESCLDPSFLTEGFLSLYRENENDWQKLPVQYTATDRIIQASFQIDREGDLFFWKMPMEETETEVWTEAETATEGENETESETEGATETENATESVIESEPETEEESETEPGTESVTETMTESWTEVSEESETEGATDIETATESETEGETETETATESETEAWTESEPETEEESETEPRTESVTETVTEPWTETPEETETEGLTELTDPDEKGEVEFSYDGETSGNADGNAVSVTVKVPAGAGIPEDAMLRAERLEEGGEAYEAAVTAAREALGISEGQDFYFQPYDIYLTDGEERVLEPQEGSVSVTMEFSGDPFADVAKKYDEVQRFAVHIRSDGTVEKPDIPETGDPQDGIYEFAVSSFSVMGPAMIGTVQKEDAPGADLSDGPSAEIPETGSTGEPSAEETYSVYELLYANGELVFQNDNTPDESKGALIATFEDDGSSASDGASNWAFYDKRNEIKTVTFKDNVPLKSLAYAFKDYTNLTKVNGGTLTAPSSLYKIFEGCKSLTTVDLSGWDVTAVTHFGFIFSGCSSLSSLDISGWTTPSATSVFSTFYNCSSLKEIDVSGWTTEKVDNMISTFQGCSQVETLDLSRWSTDKLDSSHMNNMFANCGALNKLSLGSGFIFKNHNVGLTGYWQKESGGDIYTSEQIMNNEVFGGGTFVRPKVYEILYPNGELVFQTDSTPDVTKGTPIATYQDNGGSKNSASDWAFYANKEKVVTVTFKDDVKLGSLACAFAGYPNLTTVNGGTWTAPKSIAQAFNGCTSLTTANLSGWNVSAVENMGHLFENCRSLSSLNIEGWRTDSVTNIYLTFSNCSSLKEIDVSGWTTDKVTNMISTFQGCSQVETLDLSKWSTKAVPQKESMANLFANCGALNKLSLGSGFIFFKNHNVGLTGYWQKQGSEEIYTSEQIMNNGAGEGTFVKFAVYEILYENGELVFQNNRTTDPAKGSVLQIYADDGSGTKNSASNWAFYGNREKINTVTFKDDVKLGSLACAFAGYPNLTTVNGGTLTAPSSLYKIFEDCKSLTTADLSGWDVSAVTDFGYIFNGCSSLSSLNISGWKTTSATTVHSTFNNCSSLKKIDVSGWTTDKVNYMISTFQGCSQLEELDLGSWDTQTVPDQTWMNNMLANCSALNKLTLGSNFIFKNVDGYNANVGLTGYWQKEDDGKIYTSEQIMNNVAGAGTFVRPTVYEILYENGELVFQNSQHTDLAKGSVLKTYEDDGGGAKKSAADWAFYENRDKINTVTFKDNVPLGSLAFAFSGYTNLTTVNGGTLTAPSSLRSVFENCTSLTTANLSGWDVSAVTDFGYVFNGCSRLSSLNISGWKTTSVTTLHSTFNNCSSLKKIDVSGWTTDKVNYMISTFQGCSQLEELDLSSWNTHSVPDQTWMSNMMANCSALNRLTLGENFIFVKKPNLNANVGLKGFWQKEGSGDIYTSEQVMDNEAGTGTFIRPTVYAILYENGELVFQNSQETDLAKGSVLKIYEDDGSGAKNSAVDWAFYENRDKINIVTFKNNVPLGSLAFAFSGYPNLTTVNGGTLKAPSSLYKIFENCKSLTTANLSGWDVTAVTHFGFIFSGCSSLSSLNIKGWTTPSATSVYSTFNNCSSLTEIDVSGWTTEKVDNMIMTFQGCSQVETLDLSGWSTEKVPDSSHMADMFANCGALNKLSLGGKFKFKGGNFGLTGYWQKEDRGKIYTSEQIMNNEAGAGTFVRPTVYEILYENGELVFQNSQQTDPAKGSVLKIYEDDGSGAKNSAADWAFYENRDKINIVTFKDNVPLGSLAFAFSGYTNLTTVNGGTWTAPKSIAQAFNGCTSLTNANLSGWNVSAVENMGHLFENCRSLSSLNIEGWRTDSVTNIYLTFSNCSSLKEIDVSGWTTDKVTNMISTFQGCSQVETLDLSGWSTEKVTDSAQMANLFANCGALSKLSLGSGFIFKNNNVGLTGYWQKEDTGEEYTAQALMAKYDGIAEQGTYNKFVRITFNGSGGVATPKSLEGYLGMTVETLPTATREGYYFRGWFTEPNGKGKQLEEGGQATKLVYYAQWEPYTYTLRLHAQNDGRKTIDVELKFDQFYQLSEALFPPDDETTFLVGWNTRADGTGEMYDPNARVSGLADQDRSTVHLYAIWGDLNDYVTLSFDTDGGSTIPPMRVKKGESVYEKDLPKPTKENHIFKDWSIGSPGSYKLGQGSYCVMDKDITFYANWTPFVTVTLDPCMDELETLTIRMPKDSIIESLPQYSPRKDGKSLIGWFDQRTGDQVIAGVTRPYWDVTYYAYWAWRPEFDTNGGTYVGEFKGLEPRENGPEYTIGTLPEVKRDGFTFLGWFWNGKQVNVGDTLDISQGTEIVAQWEETQHFDITLEPNGGEIDKKKDPVTIHAYSGKPVGNLPTPERKGYVFLGWYDEEDNLCTLNTEFTRSHTLTAKWAEAVTVKFMDKDDQGDADELVTELKVAKGGTIPSLPGAKKNKHILEGWYTDLSDEGTKLTTGTKIEENTTYYAKWRNIETKGEIGGVEYTCGIEWGSASNENVDNVGDRLVFHPTDTKEQTAELHVHFSTNAVTQGEDSVIPVGAVKIKIPKYVWMDWNQKPVGTENVETSMSGSSDKNIYFAISESESDDEYYVLTNREAIPGGAGMDARFSYTVDPTKVPGGGIDEAGNYVTGEGIDCYNRTFPVEITVSGGEEGKPPEKFKKKLSIEMHTRVITSAWKSAGEIYYVWQSSWGKKPADASDYFYIEWPLVEKVESTTNQPFTFTWSEENTIHDGTVVKIVAPVEVQPAGTYTYEEADKMVIVKYPRTMLVPNGVVSIHNEAIVTEDWKSGYQTSHRVSADVNVPYWQGVNIRKGKAAYDVENDKGVKHPAQKAGGQEDILEGQEVSLGWNIAFEAGPKDSPTWDDAAKTYTAKEHTISVRDGMEKNLLYSSGAAADKYLWEPSTGNTVLSDEDYYFDSISLNVTEFDGEYYPEDRTWSLPMEHENTGDYGIMEIFVRYKNSENLVLFRSLRRNELRRNENELKKEDPTVSLPKDTCGVEVRYTTSFFKTAIRIKLNVRLKPSATISRLIRQDVAMDTTSLVKNFARYQAWEEDPGERYIDETDALSGSASEEVWEMNISETKQFLRKSVPTSEHSGLLSVDKKHGVQDLPVCLSGWLYNTSTSNRIRQLETGIFYDLLPMGTTVDPSTVFGVWFAHNNWASAGAAGYPANNYKDKQNDRNRLPDSLIDVSFVDNWEGSRRTMMVIRFAMPEGVSANGIDMFYLLGNTYENIMANGATQENDAAFVDTTEFSSTPVETGEKITNLNAQQYFKSLDAEYSGKIAYNEISTNYVPIDISTWGFDKEVKAEGATYSQKDTALLNNTYTWRLTYAQGTGTRTKGIVFFDVLETGFYEKAEGGGKTLVDSEWQGSFMGINVESLKKLKMKVKTQDGKTEEKYLDPVVYYSTKGRSSFQDGMPDLKDQQVWTTDCPEDPSTVTAIAVDCSKCTDGSDFQLEDDVKDDADAMQVFLTMRAPMNGELVGKTARNRASLYMTHIDSENQKTSVMMDAGASVVLKDIDPELHKTSDPGSGTEKAPAAVYQNEQLTYTLSVKNVDSETVMNNIVVEDEIPEAISVQTKDVKVRFGNDATATPVATSPRVTLEREGRQLAFTINMLYPGETVYLEITGTVSVKFQEGTDGKLEEVTFSNQARIPSVNGVHKNITSETTWHKVIPVGFNISKIGVGGRPLAGAKLQLYKKNEGAEPGAELNDPNAYTTKDEWIWTSDGTTKIFEDMEKGTYVIREESAPAGHLVTEDITVEFDGKGGLKMNGKIVPEVTVKDDYTKVRFKKFYCNPEAPQGTSGQTNLAGAKMEVYHKDDFVYADGKPVKPMENKEPVAKWTTTGQPYVLEGVLDYGKLYVLYEAEAPEGYQKAEPSEFTPTQTSSSDGIFEWTMEDKLASFEIKARKEDPVGNPLAKARLRITGTRYDPEEAIDPIVWDTTVDDHTVRLYPGSYTLTEVFAPDGYALGDPIHFTVEEGTTANTAILKVNGESVEDLTLKMVDQLAQDLVVQKTVKGKADASDKAYGFALKLSRRDGTPFTSAFTYEIRNKDGEITGTGVLSEKGTEPAANAAARVQELLEIAVLSESALETRASVSSTSFENDTDSAEEGIYKFKLKDGESITIKDIPQDLLYEVTEETERDAAYVSSVTNGSGMTKGTETTKVTVTNTYPEKGTLVVTKTVIGSWAPEDADYTIEITPDEGKTVYGEGGSKDTVKVYRMSPGGDSTEEMPNETVTIGESLITVKLKGGERIVIKGLAPGTYTVTETEPSEGPGEAAFRAEYKVNGEVAQPAKVTISDVRAGNVEVRNLYSDLGELTVEKAVAGGTAPKEGEDVWYDVQISSIPKGAFENYKIIGSSISSGDLPQGDILADTPARGEKEAAAGQMTVEGEEAETQLFQKVSDENGILRFKLRAGSRVTITGLPVGIYTVTEMIGETDEYRATYTVTEGEGMATESGSGCRVSLKKTGSGGVPSDGYTTGAVKITNQYPDPVSMTLSGTKAVIGKDLESGKYHFAIEADESNPVGGVTLPDSRTVANTESSGQGFRFEPISFKKAGTYILRVRETSSEDPVVGIDSTVYKVTVTVEKNNKTGEGYAYEITQTVIERIVMGADSTDDADDSGGTVGSGGAGTPQTVETYVKSSGKGEPENPGPEEGLDASKPIPPGNIFQLPQQSIEGDEPPVAASFINYKIEEVELPNTGGRGTGVLMWISILLFLAGCFGFLLSRKRKTGN